MRTAIFVDAGYLYAAGAGAISGGERLTRRDVKLNVPNVVTKLKEIATRTTDGHPLLRIYWYDATPYSRPLPEQEELADTEDVKLRLGAMTYGGRQKGVDSLIVTDLIDLARNRAISDAVLLSGDEDTRIGVQIAQSFGVRIHLIGIRAREWNQSRSLKRESDTTTEWFAEEVGYFLTRTPSEVDHVARVEETGDFAVNQSDLVRLQQTVTDFVRSCSSEELRDIGPGLVPFRIDSKLLRTCSIELQRDLEVAEKQLVRKLLKELAASE